MEFQITLIPGDGIGPEIVTEARKVLDAVGTKFGHTFSYKEILMGGASIDATGEPLTKEALETARNSDAVLLGASSALPAACRCRSASRCRFATASSRH